MRNFHDNFETRRQKFISALSNCMIVPLTNWKMSFIISRTIPLLILKTSVASSWRFFWWMLTDLSFTNNSSKFKVVSRVQKIVVFKKRLKFCCFASCIKKNAVYFLIFIIKLSSVLLICCAEQFECAFNFKFW